MKPIPFPEQTKILAKPDSMTDEQCSAMPVWNGDGNTCISCWQGGWRERLRFLFTGRMYAGVLSGQTQPPIWLSAINPFK